MTSHAKKETIETDLEACNEQLAEMTHQRDSVLSTLAVARAELEASQAEVAHLRKQIGHYQNVMIEVRRWCNKISNYSARYWYFPWRTLNDINNFALDLRDALEANH
jgi:uncharacterized protein (DUF3084 family)